MVIMWQLKQSITVDSACYDVSPPSIRRLNQIFTLKFEASRENSLSIKLEYYRLQLSKNTKYARIQIHERKSFKLYIIHVCTYSKTWISTPKMVTRLRVECFIFFEFEISIISRILRNKLFKQVTISPESNGYTARADKIMAFFFSKNVALDCQLHKSILIYLV